MAYRGGGGRVGFGVEYAKAEPFVIFPEVRLHVPESISDDEDLRASYASFQRFWRYSPYYLGDGVLKKESESLEIERFSDALKPKKMKYNKRGSFYDYLVRRPDNFPTELLGDTRRQPVKRARWTQDANLQKLDDFEKLEAKSKAQGKEEDEREEDDDDDEVGESEGQDSDNGDYDQNEDFDDDDDDYNLADDGDYEEVY